MFAETMMIHVPHYTAEQGIFTALKVLRALLPTFSHSRLPFHTSAFNVPPSAFAVSRTSLIGIVEYAAFSVLLSFTQPDALNVHFQFRDEEAKVWVRLKTEYPWAGV